MTSVELFSRLETIASSNDVETQSTHLVKDLLQDNQGLDAIDPILWCMEKNSGIDFGPPGPLVQFLERFHGKGYEQKLIESIRRKPTNHTVWMLNRLINAAQTTTEKLELTALMQTAETHSRADSAAKRIAGDFLKRRRQE
ncbi:MAG TPA: hypothetical protein VKV04_01075 [Verrucomicrobiae bacterium]|nr:hypothetical protein [Verrucomicrobiae bacterium]